MLPTSPSPNLLVYWKPRDLRSKLGSAIHFQCDDEANTHTHTHTHTPHFSSLLKNKMGVDFEILPVSNFFNALKTNL